MATTLVEIYALIIPDNVTPHTLSGIAKLLFRTKIRIQSAPFVASYDALRAMQDRSGPGIFHDKGANAESISVKYNQKAAQDN